MVFNIELQRRAVVVFTAGLCLLFIIGLVSFVSLNTYHQLNDKRTQSRETIEALDGLLAILIDTENGERGYFATGEEKFLEPFQVSQEKLEKQIERIRNLVRADAEQSDAFSKLSPVLRHRMDVSIKNIEARLNGDTSRERELEAHSQGKEIMDRARALITQMKTEENRQLTETTAASDRRASLVQWATVIGTSVSFMAVLMAFYITNLDTIRRNRLAKELQTARQKAIEASKMKSAFLANMSHEIRTPMNGVIGLSEMLLRTSLANEQRKYVDSIRRSAVSLLSIINGILDLSKIESGKFELESTYFELAHVIEEAMSTVKYAAEGKKVALEINRAEDVPQAYMGDPLRIRQVLINLLNNAVKFSEKGTVRVGVRFVPKENSKGEIEIEIHDEGIGMSEDTRSRLFTAFNQGDQSTTRRYGGTGLGLSITKELVTLMRGHIEVQSELGKGSTFRLTIPLEQVALIRQRSASDERPLRAPTQEKLRVLVAEDNDINREVINSMLTALGHTAEYVAHGRDAVTAMKKGGFDLVFMDCHMPEMDGFEATRLIRQIPGDEAANVPIIAITASAVKGDLEQCILCGMNDYISKPMTLQDLSSKIELWSPKAQSVSQQIVDVSVIQALQELAESSDPQLVDKLLRLFISSREDIRRMHETQKSGDFEKLRLDAHKLKSSYANLGLARMRSLCQKIEASANKETVTALGFQVVTLELEHELAVRHLKRAGYLATNSTTSIPKAG